MRIYACIPSFNEAQTIGHVATLIDQGLQDFSLAHGRSMDASIINVDSASTDGTPDIFRGTDTYFLKRSIVLPEPRGKGKNLLAFAELARTDEATHCITIDADIRSMTPGWISTLLTPLVSGRADFVSPSYQRSQFEGSTTNHFAYPIVLATTGKHVRQPIAGDFAFTRALLEMIANVSAPISANYYGIDIYLTLLALSNGLRHEEVALGKKVHNPSFSKLEYMFPQIAATTLFMLRRIQISERLSEDDLPIESNIIPATTFAHRDAAESMRARAQSQLRNTDIGLWNWVPPELLKKSDIFDKGTMSSDDWIATLTSWLMFGYQNQSVSTDLLAEQLLPFLVLRATSFWFSSERMTSEETEREIRQQAQILSARLRTAIQKGDQI